VAGYIQHIDGESFYGGEEFRGFLEFQGNPEVAGGEIEGAHGQDSQGDFGAAEPAGGGGNGADAATDEDHIRSRGDRALQFPVEVFRLDRRGRNLMAGLMKNPLDRLGGSGGVESALVGARGAIQQQDATAHEFGGALKARTERPAWRFSSKQEVPLP